MEACRDVCLDGHRLLVDYSYSKSSLEEVFINFARLKENHGGDDDSIKGSSVV